VRRLFGTRRVPSCSSATRQPPHLAQQGHARPVECLSILHWGILFEIGDGYARLGRRSKGQALLDRLWNEERYCVAPLTDSLVQQGLELYQARSDKEWGLTDCLSFALMKREAITEALTADVHSRQAGFEALLLQGM